MIRIDQILKIRGDCECITVWLTDDVTTAPLVVTSNHYRHEQRGNVIKPGIKDEIFTKLLILCRNLKGKGAKAFCCVTRLDGSFSHLQSAYS